MVAVKEPVEMNREEMIAIMADRGYDTSLITDAVPDAFLREVVKWCNNNPDSAEETVKTFADKNADVLPKMGITRESLLNGFKAWRRYKPNGTAREFLSGKK